jgi:hypothetical protein
MRMEGFGRIDTCARALAQRTLGRDGWVSCGAWVAVVALHSLFIAPLVLGGSAHRRPTPPDQLGAGASALRSRASIAEAMTLVDLSHLTTSQEPPLEDLASLGIERPLAGLLIAGPDPFPPPVLDTSLAESETTEAAGDTQGHAEMFGRYRGQISARIQRAWRRPRHPVGAPRFACQAKIEQDQDGRVLSVELRRCNGDARWQRSLVTAIEHASPLPSPPIPSVFASTLMLDFSASPFESGVADESEYEPEARLAAREPTAPLGATTEKITNEQQTLENVRDHRGHIDLRVEGNTITWTLRDAPEASSEHTRNNGCEAGC